MVEFLVIIEEKLENPTQPQLQYYKEVLGDDFELSTQFIKNALSKWIAGLHPNKQMILAQSLYNTLSAHKLKGKNISIIKNVYIKFMCWIYYKFSTVLKSTLPDCKILYCGVPSVYEAEMIAILEECGVTVVIAQDGDKSKYITVRPAEPPIEMHTNDWIKGDIFEAILTNRKKHDKKNVFVMFKGCENKANFIKSLNKLYTSLTDDANRVVIIEDGVQNPQPNEISKILRNNATDIGQLINSLVPNVVIYDKQLATIAQRQLQQLIMALYEAEGNNLQKTNNKVVQMLALYKRYEAKLFGNAKDTSVFIVFGDITTQIQLLLVEFLSLLPIDVIIVSPNLESKCDIEDDRCLIIKGNTNLDIDSYPMTLENMQVGTVAYNAEQELNTMIYQDTGLYRQNQYAVARSLTLKTTCEEIDILWQNELKFRPNFDTSDEKVDMPVIFAKISGVKNSDKKEYYKRIQKFIIPQQTIVCVSPPFIEDEGQNLIGANPHAFFRNGKLNKDAIMAHKDYKYSHLREEMQHHLLDKIQLLIDLKWIEGTGTNGMEYKIVSLLLNLGTKFLRQMQKFDFTKMNPKVVVIHTKERMHEIEDAIFIAYANLVGCDIIIISPTGYRSLERFYTMPILNEHQDGEYLYDIKAREALEKDKVKGFLGRVMDKWQ
ncbi:MAG: hypothetical protein ATN35_08240 [Epulopiscium sp. Nele67-Bin004]|nr:MAG: hypothetical protein ATN35_08240 [Epulopiscium sp. Nele67-Bin004]